MKAKPAVSIVVPYYHGIEHLPLLLESISQQSVPLDEIECLLVQNSEDDGLHQLVEARFPWARILEPGENLGYGGGCNYGARHATGEWVAFLNTDMRLHESWLAELLAASERHPGAACFGSAILSWSGRRIDFGGSAMSFMGVGFQTYHGAPKSWLPKADHQELFVCGGATFIRRDVCLDVGGFDEDFWAYYEDVDLGWRLWILGHEVWLVPSSIVYHRHHGSFSQVGQERTRLLYERNAILSVIKNYEDEHLCTVLPVVMMLAAKRAFLASGVEASKFRIGRTPPQKKIVPPGPFNIRYYVNESVRIYRNDGLVELGKRIVAELGRRFTFGGQVPYSAPAKEAAETPDGIVIPEMAVAHMLALSDVADYYPSMLKKRSWIQERRKRADREIFPLFGMSFALNFFDSRYHNCVIDLVKACGIEDVIGEYLNLEEDDEE